MKKILVIAAIAAMFIMTGCTTSTTSAEGVTANATVTANTTVTANVK